MIVLASADDQKKILDFCANSAVGCRIAANLASYGTDNLFSQFWLIIQENSVCGIINMLDGAVSVLGANEQAYLEAAQFCSLLSGVSEIVTQQNGSGAIMQRTKGFNLQIKTDVRDGCASDIYSILQSDKSCTLKICQKMYVDFSHRLRHDTLLCAAVYMDNQPVCCACAHIANDDALITAVTTVPKFRNMGFATAAVTYLCEKLKTRNIFLMCNNNLTTFYKKMGFTTIGGYTIDSNIL